VRTVCWSAVIVGVSRSYQPSRVQKLSSDWRLLVPFCWRSVSSGEDEQVFSGQRWRDTAAFHWAWRRMDCSVRVYQLDDQNFDRRASINPAT